MKAKKNTIYALIENNIVTHKFDSTQLKEWDENAITAIEIPKGKNIEIGTQYDSLTNTFIDKSLEKQKEALINRINFLFEREADYIQDATQNKKATYEIQKKEAQNLAENENVKTPFLDKLAEQRQESKKVLAQKILVKNEVYTQRLAKLLGYKQKLIKQVERAQTQTEIDDIKYISPLNETE